jgi:CheY-like chemotaxis protein
MSVPASCSSRGNDRFLRGVDESIGKLSTKYVDLLYWLRSRYICSPYLPATSAPETEMLMSPEHYPRQRVLVVQRDDALRETLREVLEDTGYEVLEAREGEDALAILHNEQGGMVVILDQFMPRLDGAELLREVAQDRKLTKSYSFILLSAARLSMRIALIRLLTKLAVQVISKPFDVDDFLAAVATASQRLSSL